MRAFIASLVTETNTFAPFPTGMAAFEENHLIKHASRTNEGMGAAGLSVFRALAEADGFEVVESLTAYAQPGGRTLRAVYEGLRDEILEDLRRAGAVDLVLLLLHGAMVAEGYDDCEADTIARIRALAPDAVIGVELDPHCHLTVSMVEAADFLVLLKEYPHTDVGDRAADLYRLCLRRVRNETQPVAVLMDTHMIGLYPTTSQPMRGIVDELMKAEADGTVLSASIAHGFPWGDVADVGTRVLVYADGSTDTALREATRIANSLYSNRQALLPRYPDVASSVEQALKLSGRVVIGDHSDNPGGGAAGDSTFFLREIVSRGMTDVALGPLWDPMVAALCCEAGAGSRLAVRIGGKTGPASGDPVDLDVEIRATSENHQQTAFGSAEPMGKSACLHCRGIDIVVVSQRAQGYGLDLFEGLGIDLLAKKLIVVKSSRHYETAFAPIADHLWAAVSPGALSIEFGRLSYSRRDAEFFPRVEDPWNSRGESARVLVIKDPIVRPKPPFSV